jgi:hypothetical protein
VDQNILGIVIKFCKFTETRNDIKSHAEYKEHFKFIYSYSLAAPFNTLLMPERHPPPPITSHMCCSASQLFTVSVKCPCSLRMNYAKHITNPQTPVPKAVTSGESGAPKVVPCNRSLTSEPFASKYCVEPATEFSVELWRCCAVPSL